MTKNNQPARIVRLGAMRAAVWRNPSEKGTRFSVTLERVYRTDEGEWQYTCSFGRDDLLLAAKVLDLAHSAIFELIAEDRASEANAGQDAPTEAPTESEVAIAA
jgi:hypothetical protein